MYSNARDHATTSWALPCASVNAEGPTLDQPGPSSEPQAHWHEDSDTQPWLRAGLSASLNTRQFTQFPQTALWGQQPKPLLGTTQAPDPTAREVWCVVWEALTLVSSSSYVAGEATNHHLPPATSELSTHCGGLTLATQSEKVVLSYPANEGGQETKVRLRG